MSKPLIFAHRGASGHFFENTMKAFIGAVEEGADGIELDVQLTEDGIPVVLHDLYLNRLAGIRKKVYEMTYSELQKVRVGKRFFRLFFGHKIPNLYEVAAFCDHCQLHLNIELKESFTERIEYVKEIIRIIEGNRRVHISSFDYTVIQKVKEIDPTIKTALLVKKKTVNWEKLNQYNCADGFNIHKKFLAEPYFSKLKNSGKSIRVYAMTGNERIIANPPSVIIGWITDFPYRFKNKELPRKSNLN